MKINSKYTKNIEKWLDIYKLCKLKLYQFSTKIISLIDKKQNKNVSLYLRKFRGIKLKEIIRWIKTQKLTILDKYILKNFILAFLSVVSVLILVIVGRLFVRLLQHVVEGRFDIDVVYSLLFLSTSKSIILLLPFALMIGLIISLSKFYRDSEIYALKASGNYKIIFTKLFYLIAIPSFLVIFFLNIFASPYLITEIQKKKIEAAATSEIGLTTPGKFIQMKDKNWIIFVEEIENDISKRIFIKSSENNKISIETAEEGDEYLEGGVRRLILKNGQRYTGTPGTGNFQVMKYDKHEVKLLNTTPDFSLNYRMKNIFDLIFDQNESLANAEIQWRLFAPISVIVLILFAFVFGDVAPRQNKYSNLLSAIIVYFIYSNLVIVSVNQIQRDTLLFSIIGAWWVHILAFAVCYLLYIKNKLQINNYKNLIILIKKLRR
jgi:lipopolysaccharide export system permease protein